MVMKVELRNGSVHISGYVNAVGRDSRQMYDSWGCPFVEQVSAGAFDKAIKRADDIGLMKNHETVIGGIESGNLKLVEDNIGLYAECDVEDAEVIECAEAGKLKGWSFGFYEQKAHAEQTADPECRRRILDEIDLLEVSILTSKTPAYFGTSIEARQDDGKTKHFRTVDLACEVVDARSDGRAEKEADKISLELKKRELEILKLKF